MRKVKLKEAEDRFQEALLILVEKLKSDKNVLAAILAGSLSYDEVWEKSDIDLILMSKDGKLKGGEKFVCLTELDVNIHAWMLERDRWKKMIESSLRSSFIHSYFSKSTLLFTRDDSLKLLYESVEKLGSRDQQSQLLAVSASIMPIIFKVEKFLYIKNDPQYAYIWLSSLYPGLAKLEVNLHGKIASREVIHQALELNPSFFKEIYTKLIDLPKTFEHVDRALQLVDSFLTERIEKLFRVLLDFLAQDGIIKSATEIDTWAEQEMNIDGLVSVCEWLADKEIIHRASTPMRLTPTSLEEVEELAFYYE